MASRFLTVGSSGIATYPHTRAVGTPRTIQSSFSQLGIPICLLILQLIRRVSAKHPANAKSKEMLQVP